jgi:hypothetical protein
MHEDRFEAHFDKKHVQDVANLVLREVVRQYKDAVKVFDFFSL